jgi:hypothetical protein
VRIYNSYPSLTLIIIIREVHWTDP